mmetsp:Transcript_6182/g.11020  ORF Transcript_6182/g.11020 Transcript_6182/m.11020 type:complete len:275 (-) Transcript_6182:2261-3085(-)
MILELTAVGLFVGSGYAEPVWKFLSERYSENVLLIGGMFISLVLGYFLGSLPYIILDTLQIESLQKYKIQSGKYPSRSEMLKTSMSLMMLFCGVMLPMIILGTPAFKLLGMRFDLPLPRWNSIVIQVLFFFIVEDFLNYWFHRWLHTPWAYKNIHSVHHENTSPFALSATYAHPIEVILLGIPTFTGPFLVQPHLFTLWIWLMMRQYEAIDIHSGYEFPWNINSVFKFYAGAEHHDYHHYMFSGNFASVFTWCDKLYGTGLGYESFQVKKMKAQ